MLCLSERVDIIMLLSLKASWHSIFLVVGTTAESWSFWTNLHHWKHKSPRRWKRKCIETKSEFLARNHHTLQRGIHKYFKICVVQKGELLHYTVLGKSWHLIFSRESSQDSSLYSLQTWFSWDSSGSARTVKGKQQNTVSLEEIFVLPPNVEQQYS